MVLSLCLERERESEREGGSFLVEKKELCKQKGAERKELRVDEEFSRRTREGSVGFFYCNG
jgi:hypothetical protein